MIKRCLLVATARITLVLSEVHNKVCLGFVLGVVNHGTGIAFVFRIEPNARLVIAGVLGVIHNAVRLRLVLGDKDLGIGL